MPTIGSLKPVESIENDAALNRNPFHNIPADFPLPPVIEPGGARIGMPGEALDVFERDVLLQQVGDGVMAEDVINPTLSSLEVRRRYAA